MIDLHFAPTPNGWKVSIMLEECALPYTVVPVNITRGDQFKAEFRTLNPNGRIPVIVDGDPPSGGAPVTIFESGTILLYLAEKTGRLFPRDLRDRYQVQQWLMWQMSALGPMLGQNGHFSLYAPEKIPYAIERYRNEAHRLYGVLDDRLGETAYVAGDAYSIADIACFPWVMTHKAQGFSLDEFVHVRRWFAELRERPLLQKGLAVGRRAVSKTLDDTARENLFGTRPPAAAAR
ncbi:glutathione S-transferase family protein [Bradyrhizobium ivorense]|uniref:glutathione S-transferase family protein n=1 Tax=Bradyrhizobium ivorense TaxID=2511166 RepID=UPI0010B0AE2F|nr:glutathione S-transferase N-terminal domain-containing protein [Bradyrhizobium ivorense]MCC8936651.1 glutathione S-transferase N-terminal domain-containing protein [Bradyrhizobium ivorense]VIO71852.1 Disulfide-bond oxidoreductase YfcG [Bradyrhizobium ivorense]